MRRKQNTTHRHDESSGQEAKRLRPAKRTSMTNIDKYLPKPRPVTFSFPMSSRTYLVSLTRPAILSAAGITTRRLYTSVVGETINQNWPSTTAKKTTSSKRLFPTPHPRHAGDPAPKRFNSQSAKRSDVSGRGTVGKSDLDLEREKETALQDEIRDLEAIQRYASLNPTTDIWGQKIRSLGTFTSFAFIVSHSPVGSTRKDVMIPFTIVSPRLRSSGLKKIWYQFWKNRQNDVKNMISLVALAKENALPGVNTRSDSFSRKFFLWPLRVFSTTSTRPTSWLAPTRQMCLEIYKDLCTAIAKCVSITITKHVIDVTRLVYIRNNLKEIKRLTTDSFASETLAAQKKHKVNCSYFWHLHREINPTQVVSLRSTDGYLASEAPKFGNRLMVHALVKFDTEQVQKDFSHLYHFLNQILSQFQSLEIYDRKGNPLHEPAEGSVNGLVGRVPAKTRHVVQYLVFEKRMWYDGPWVIREQIWDIVPKKTD